MVNNLKNIIKIKKFKTSIHRIKNMEFIYNNNSYCLKELNNKHLTQLFNFFKKFSKKEKTFFGYPLFVPTNLTLKEFKIKYQSYLKEKNKWIYHLLFHKKKIIGLYFIKKIGFKNYKGTIKKTPTFGGPFVIKKYRGNKLGFLLTKICFHQAKLLKLKKLYSTVISHNIHSLKLSEMVGWKKTGRIIPLKNRVFEIEFCKTQNTVK